MERLTDKSAIRREMRLRRKSLPSAAKARASAIVCDKIAGRCERRGTVAVYLASPDEIDLTGAIVEMLAHGISLAAPRWTGAAYELAKLKGLGAGNLRKGPMGILEPEASEIVRPGEVTTWFVPGLAFTRNGGRLGYGGGWYDRLLAGADAHAHKIGVAYAFQVVETLPDEPHDILLDEIIDDSV